jgi:FkbH-like protein/FkbM family methyltransferase
MLLYQKINHCKPLFKLRNKMKQEIGEFMSSKHDSDKEQIIHPLLGQRLHSTHNEIHFESQIHIHTPAFLTHHRVYNMAIMPAAAYIEMALAAGAYWFKSENLVVEEFVIQKALILQEDEAKTIQIALNPIGKNACLFQIFSVTKSKDNQNEDLSRILHSSGKVIVKEPDSEPRQTELLGQAQLIEEIPAEVYYQQCRERDINYGSSFQVIEKLWRHEREALGKIQLPEELILEAKNYNVHPVVLDTCFQVLWAALPESVKEETYIPVSIERLQVYCYPSSCLWSYALISTDKDSTQQTLTAELCQFNETGDLVIKIEGLFIERATREALLRHLRKKQNIAITATFTAEPVEDSLVFWMQELDMPFKIEFAPYNQIFQELLNPTSLLASNRDGFNVVLLRLEDWQRNEKLLKLAIEPDKKDCILAEKRRYTIPNGLEIAHLNRYETEYLYQEIFVNQVYLKYGIVLHEDACVVDVGANIGLFTLFAQTKCPNATIYSFEPAPHAFSSLESNTALYCKNIKIFNCGLGAENKEENFTFYPNSSVFSSFSADTEQDEKAIRAVIINMLKGNNSLSEEELELLAEEFLKGRLEQETYTAQLRTLSSVIEEHNIKQIDLLKIDAEKSELAVLKGIEDNDWSIIKQIVLEVHDQEGSVLEEVKCLLKEKGFELAVEEEILLQDSGLYNIYATRLTQASNLSLKEPLSNTAKIEQNLKDLVLALESAVKRSSTPYLVYICPASPAIITDAARSTFHQQMEDLLASYLDGVSGVYLVNSSELAAKYPVVKYYDPHGDEFGKVPYTSTYFTALGTAIARKIYAIKSAPRKVIVLDCDNTLWKGVVGEDGVMGIEITSGFLALQEMMVAQQQAGMLICLCSKNNEADVVEVFEKRPDMPLRKEHIVSMRINWMSKSENIKALATELNLGLDSFILIDDNPVECAEVQAICPEVLTLQLPIDGDIPRFLNHVWAFDRLKVTEEDKQRTTLYQQNLERDRFAKESLTIEDFLAGLALKVEIKEPTPAQLPRVSQLTQRTNQFNLTTIRRSEGEIQQLLQSEVECRIVEVSDRFGDYGVVGVMIFSTGDDTINVDTFLLSCRVLGRGVEHRMLARLAEIAKERGLSRVDVTYIPTQKNLPALNFLDSLGADFKQPLDKGYRYCLPVEFAAAVSYKPQVTEPTPESDVAVKAAVATGADTPQTGKSALLNRIATELYEPEQIIKLIESQKHRARSSALESTFVAPSNQIEKLLVRIWSEVLRIDQVGIYDNFFELGGSSLLMVQVLSKLQESYSHISLVDLYKYPTIKAQAEYLGQKQGSQKHLEEEAFQEVENRVLRKQDAREQRKQRRGLRKING